MVLRSEEKRWHEAKVTAKKKRNKLEGIVMSAKILIILTSDSGSFWVFWGVPKMALGVPESKF